MIVTIYRSERAIFPLDRRFKNSPVAVWQEYSFEAHPFAASDGESFRRLRLASVPIRIKAPAGSKIVEVKGKTRLSLYWDTQGIDAETAFYVARRGEKGLSIDVGPDRANHVGGQDAGCPANLLQGADAGHPGKIEATGA